MNISLNIFVASVSINGYSVESKIFQKADYDVLSVIYWLENTINHYADLWFVKKSDHDWTDEDRTQYHSYFTEDDFLDEDDDEFTLALEDTDTNRIYVKLTKYEL